MFTGWRGLFAIAALVALGTADAPASPIHRCHQHGCKALETWRSDLDWTPFSPVRLAVRAPFPWSLALFRAGLCIRAWEGDSRRTLRSPEQRMHGYGELR